MSAARGAIVLLALAAGFPFGGTAHAQLDPAGGGTVITVEENIVTITVNLDVIIIGRGRALFEAIRGYAEPGFNAAAQFWTDALAEQLKDECFEVHVVAKVNLFAAASSYEGGGHDIYILHDVTPVFETPQLTTETTRDDTAQVFTTNGTGYFPPWMFQVEPYVTAHEMGHMFGLGDDYIINEDGTSTSLPGREGTLMDGGDVVDRVLADRVVALARRSGIKIPECHWEGSGIVRQTPLDDGARKLTRSADFDFWFDVDRDGGVTGAITLTYDAKLTVEHLPQADVGVAGFDPKVGGQVTDPNPTRTFPLEGKLDEDGLTLRIATAEAERQQLEFTMVADPGVSAGLGAGGALLSMPGRMGSVQVIRIDMMPFTPFRDPATVETGPDGPYSARFREGVEDSLIEWTAERTGSNGSDERVG